MAAVRETCPGVALGSITMLEFEVGGIRLCAVYVADAPRTVNAFRTLLPLESRLVHARWSGEACWIPFGELDLALDFENATCYPAPGELLLYRGGKSETELLFPYGNTSFASRAGALAGNHFATVTEGAERLSELGRRVLWEGAQSIRITESD